MSKTILIALDAGHARDTAGKRCSKSLDANETREWFLNDRVADYIAQRAAQYQGFKTMRVDDPTGKIDVTLNDRCVKANKANADFFLSIHHNAGINGGSGGGVVAFSYTGSTQGAAWRNALYEAVVAAGGLKGNRSEPLVANNFYVVKYTDMPAVLMECGFMDSKTDVPVILTDAYAKKIGFAMADCIAARMGLKRMQKFADVDEKAWYADEIDYCVQHGLMEGVGGNKFAPNQEITRAEVAAVVARLHKALK